MKDGIFPYSCSSLRCRLAVKNRRMKVGEDAKEKRSVVLNVGNGGCWDDDINSY